jgi:hypothetical protein
MPVLDPSPDFDARLRAIVPTLSHGAHYPPRPGVTFCKACAEETRAIADVMRANPRLRRPDRILALAARSWSDRSRGVGDGVYGSALRVLNDWLGWRDDAERDRYLRRAALIHAPTGTPHQEARRARDLADCAMHVLAPLAPERTMGRATAAASRAAKAVAMALLNPQGVAEPETATRAAEAGPEGAGDRDDRLAPIRLLVDRILADAGGAA